MNKYTEFVKTHIKDKKLEHLSQTEKMKVMGTWWAQAKDKTNKIPNSTTTKRSNKKGGAFSADDGSGFFDDIRNYSYDGGALKGKKLNNKKGGALNEDDGSGFFSTIGGVVDGVGSLLGFGLDGKKLKKGKKSVMAGHISHKGKGGNLDDGVHEYLKGLSPYLPLLKL